MAVEYEWDIETLDQYGDIIDHDFADKLSSGIIKFDEIDTDNQVLVLVRNLWSTDGSLDRSWAYCRKGDDGKFYLPNTFKDSYDRYECDVPKRFINELEKAQR